MAETHASATPPSLPTSQLNEERLEFLRADHADRVEVYEIIRKLGEEECPVSSAPAAHCDGCRKKDPRHYPNGLTTRLKDILSSWFDRASNLARQGMKSAAAF